MRGLCVPFKFFRRASAKKVCAFSQAPSFRLTSSLTTFPSTVWPASLGHHRLHHASQILDAAGPGLRDRLVDRRLDLGRIDGRRQVGLEHADLGRFLVRPGPGVRRW